MKNCKSCAFWVVEPGKWNNGTCDFVDRKVDKEPQTFEIIVRVSDDTGLRVSLKTGPDFGCVHHSAKEGTTLGNLTIETDDDFSISLNGTLYTESELNLTIDSVEELNAIKVMGPYGSPSGGKTWEIDAALAAIRANPKQFFNNMGGNRGATWYPADEHGPFFG